MGERPRPARRDVHPTGRADEQLSVQLPFQRVDDDRESGLGDVAARCGTSEMLLFSGDDELFQLLQFDIDLGFK